MKKRMIGVALFMGLSAICPASASDDANAEKLCARITEGDSEMRCEVHGTAINLMIPMIADDAEDEEQKALRLGDMLQASTCPRIMGNLANGGWKFEPGWVVNFRTSTGLIYMSCPIGTS